MRRIAIRVALLPLGFLSTQALATDNLLQFEQPGAFGIGGHAGLAPEGAARLIKCPSANPKVISAM